MVSELDLAMSRSPQFYKKYSGTQSFWIIIEKVETTLNILPRELFLLPTHKKRLENSLETLEDLRSKCFYKEFNDDNELNLIVHHLEESLERVTRKIHELNIRKIFDPALKDWRYDFQECTLLEARLKLEDDERLNRTKA